MRVLRLTTVAIATLVPIVWASPPQTPSLERRLYVTNATGISVYDIDALHAYFQANSPVGPGPANRIVRIN